MQKFNAINTYPRTFNKLLKDEVDIKACLLWTVIGVFMVVALIRLGKYVFDKVEKRDKQLRSAQQVPIYSCNDYLINTISRETTNKPLVDYTIAGENNERNKFLSNSTQRHKKEQNIAFNYEFMIFVFWIFVKLINLYLIELENGLEFRNCF